MWVLYDKIYNNVLVKIYNNNNDVNIPFKIWDVGEIG